MSDVAGSADWRMSAFVGMDKIQRAAIIKMGVEFVTKCHVIQVTAHKTLAGHCCYID